MYAEILPNVPSLKHSFHYTVPPFLAGTLRAGHLVVVPFLEQRVQGVVLALGAAAPTGVTKFKDVEALLDAEPVLSAEQLGLAQWLARETRADLIECVNLMLPNGLAKRAGAIYELVPDQTLQMRSEALKQLVLMEVQEISPSSSTRQERILSLMRKRGAMHSRQLKNAMKRSTDLQADLDTLVRRGQINKTALLDPPSVGVRHAKTARLTVRSRGQSLASAQLQLGRPSAGAALLAQLIDLWPAQPELQAALAASGCTRAQVLRLAERSMLQVLPAVAVMALAVPAPVAEAWLAEHAQAQPEAGAALAALLAANGALPQAAGAAQLAALGLAHCSTNPQCLRLTGTVLQARAQLLELRGATRRAQALEELALRAGGPLPVALLRERTGVTLPELAQLAELGLIDLDAVEVLHDPLAAVQVAPDAALALTDEQAAVWAAVHAAFEAPPARRTKPLLLHGVTGSGKTEIYLRAVAEALRRGRGAIVLVPEIALTPQTVRRFMARFAGRVAVLHSRLTPNERYDSWRRVRSGALDVVIGPRSALFAPLRDVGVIVVDEAHDQAYWQDSVPYYHARTAAIERARQCAAVCILGSATPDVVDSFRAQQGTYTLLSLPRRILAHAQAAGPGAAAAQYAPLPPVHVVDMRHELRAGNRSIFSRLLASQLAQVLQRGEQAILFLNRRGQATYVFCRDCGHVLQCPRCNIAYTFHTAPERLLCHHCNAQRAAPAACPECKSARIRHFGLGTEAVESALQVAFPGVRAVRWDADSTRQRGAHAAILQQFATHAADVLIGTQMIAKGLDLPLVTLVGVVSADTGLAMPDYRASERVFSVLLQVAGRAGRGQRAGQVVLQTYQPEHFAIQAAAAHDYAAFYKQELALRRNHGYPPFGRVARLVGQHVRADELQAAAQALGAALQAQRAADVDIIGPVPCFYQRVNGLHRWQIVLRGALPAALLDVALPAGWRVEVDPVSLL